ncbi:MAG TPA: ThiF family adenylyltransferase [Actinomycetes bacterium]|nr:ThiF family adenylyltransferase [Actinomycetes bacterium]
MQRPRVKTYWKQTTEGGITLIQELGVQATLPDPDGQVLALLELADGTRALPELHAAMAERWPELTRADVAAGLAGLDDAGLLEDAAAGGDLSPWQRERYFSNLAFFGTFATLDLGRADFQARLMDARVVLLGAGGLGSTLLQNLAGLGVGEVVVVDRDRVEPRNLARQFLYSEAEIGLPKVHRAVARARAFNSESRFTAVERWVRRPEDLDDLIPGADLVLSAIDQPIDVQKWVNQACVRARVPYVTGGMQVTRGLYYSIDPGRSGCLSCWKSDWSDATTVSQLSEGGERVNRGLGPVASLVSSLMALETVRYLTGYAPPVSAGRLWLVDLVGGRVDVGYEWRRRPDCPMCGHLASGRERAGAPAGLVA